MKTRIILSCSILNYGGVGKILNFVATNLLANGWEVYVISLRDEERPSFLPLKAKFISLKKKRFKYSMLCRLEEIVNLRLSLRKLTPFTICTFGSEPSVVVRLATLGMKELKIVSAERSDPYTLPRMWKKLSSWAYSLSDYCVFQLDKQRDFYKENIRKKSFVIPNPFIPTNACVKNKGKRKVVVSAGRFVYQKGYDTLIRAFAIVSKRHPDYTLELYGGGSEKPLYESLIEELRLIGKVHLFEYTTNISDEISSCSVFVLSSRFEGIPNVLIEAMAAGVPTVSTDCTPGGPAFLTNNGERGLLVKVDDVDAMAEAICSILESPELMLSLADAGSKVCDILDEKIIAKQWIEMFAIITTKKNGKNSDN